MELQEVLEQLPSSQVLPFREVQENSLSVYDLLTFLNQSFTHLHQLDSREVCLAVCYPARVIAETCQLE